MRRAVVGHVRNAGVGIVVVRPVGGIGSVGAILASPVVISVGKAFRFRDAFAEKERFELELVRNYLGSVVSYRDNFFASLNAAVFSDGTFVYIPSGVRCPMEL